MIVLLIALLVIAFAFGVGGYTFFAACKRCDLDWSDRQAVEKTPLGAYYPQYQQARSWAWEHGCRKVSITSQDGLRLQGYWIPAEKPRGTILLIHGYHSTGFTDFAAAMPVYHGWGFNILLPCHRAHGESEGKYITYGVLENRDMQDWIQFHNQNFGQIPLIVSGLSMGAATTMYLADQPLPENVKSLIADCGFTTPKEIIAHVFRKTTKIPAWTVMWSVGLFARVFGGFCLAGKNTVRTLAKNTRPILMIHGAADDFVPCNMTLRGYAACEGPKDLLIVEGAGHGVCFSKATEEYTARVKELLGRCLEDTV